MLEGLESVIQRMDGIQKKMQHYANYGENFAKALAEKTGQSLRNENADTINKDDANKSESAKIADALALQGLNNTFAQSLLGGMDTGEGGGDFPLTGISSPQALLQTALGTQSGAHSARRLQDVTSRAVRLSPAAYGEAAFDQQIRQASIQFGLPFALIKAVVHQESQFNPNAVSRAGAQGLMQIMPKTGQYLGLRNPFDAGENIMAGSAYLKEMLERYSGNLPLALAAYNAGPNAVDAAGGVPNYPETKEYVQRVLSYYGRYS